MDNNRAGFFGIKWLVPRTPTGQLNILSRRIVMKLTQARLKSVLDYDPASGIFNWKISLSSTAGVGDIAGCKNFYGYLVTRIDGKLYLNHRLAWVYVNGYFPENDIDHIDRNRTNNKIDNLREVSRACNLRNCGNPVTNTSGVKGVYWKKRDNKWYAQIKDNGKKYNLGIYSAFDDAVFARLAGEQSLNWPGCNSSSPAYKYARSILRA